MVDYLLSEDEIMVRDLARRFARERVAPVAAELDEKEEFPQDLLRDMARSDLFAISVPEEYGGTGESLFSALPRSGGIELGMPRCGHELCGVMARLGTHSHRGEPRAEAEVLAAPCSR
jgi:Acyl-CoA dehydrogenases